MTRSPRQARLEAERQRLEALNKESDHVRVEPLEVLPGQPPEKYKVTFLCRGIVGIKQPSQEPIYGDRHEVTIYCDHEFPAEVPRLRWLTAIWHPNIQHDRDKNVCVNRHEWLGGMGLDDLCQQMFEMVQYQNYHALHSPPFPLDAEVAKWVREHAEPRGIVDKKRAIAVDHQPFVRGGPRIRFQPAQPAVSFGGRVRFGSLAPMAAASRGSTSLVCANCGAELAPGSRFCGDCGMEALLKAAGGRIKFVN